MASRKQKIQAKKSFRMMAPNFGMGRGGKLGKTRKVDALKLYKQMLKLAKR